MPQLVDILLFTVLDPTVSGSERTTQLFLLRGSKHQVRPQNCLLRHDDTFETFYLRYCWYRYIRIKEVEATVCQRVASVCRLSER